jgi:hypothetical protein
VHPDFLDNIFDNGPVIWAARGLLVSAALVLAVGGVYVIVSTVVRMRNREWLRRAGPFEVSEASIGAVVDQIHYWREKARTRQREVELTERALAATDDLVERLYGRLDDPR